MLGAYSLSCTLGSKLNLKLITGCPCLTLYRYDWEYDGDSSADKPDTSTSEVISHSLTTLLDDLSAHHSALDPRRLPFAIGLPFYTPRRYFPTIQDGAAKAGLIASDKSGLVTYSDVAAHKLYNAQLCIHHIHPHAPLCSSGGFERGIFDTLVFEYSASILSITWIETLSPMTYTFGGFADTSLGKESQKNERNYWNAMSERLLPLVQSIDKERSREDPRPPTSELGKNQIIFLGSLGEDKPLRYFLRDVLSKTRFDFDQTIVHDSIEPQHTGACAIAALLKAIIDDPEPPHCSESVECEELREKIYHQALSDHGPGDEL